MFLDTEETWFRYGINRVLVYRHFRPWKTRLLCVINNPVVHSHHGHEVDGVALCRIRFQHIPVLRHLGCIKEGVTLRPIYNYCYMSSQIKHTNVPIASYPKR